MNVFLDFPLLSTFTALVMVFVIIKVVRSMGGTSQSLRKECTNCGETMPLNAGYCRRCGSKAG